MYVLVRKTVVSTVGDTDIDADALTLPETEDDTLQLTDPDPE